MPSVSGGALRPRAGKVTDTFLRLAFLCLGFGLGFATIYIPATEERPIRGSYALGFGLGFATTRHARRPKVS
jgi:hypothetical protein